MIGLELLVPGTGTTAVVRHLADVQHQAHRDLRKAPEHLEHLSRILDVWAAAAIADRATLDRADRALAVSQFAQPLPPASATRTHAANAGRIVADLRTHRWLILAIGGGRSRALYRPAVGAPFGVTR